MLYVSVAVLDKNSGKLKDRIETGIALNNLQLQSDEIVSWQTSYRTVAPEFDWARHILKFGDAVAYIDPTKGGETQQIPHIDVRIEGKPQDVYHLIEQVVLLMGGKILTCDPPPISWWKAFVAWYKQMRTTMQAKLAS